MLALGGVGWGWRQENLIGRHGCSKQMALQSTDPRYPRHEGRMKRPGRLLVDTTGTLREKTGLGPGSGCTGLPGRNVEQEAKGHSWIPRTLNDPERKNPRAGQRKAV